MPCPRVRFCSRRRDGFRDSGEACVPGVAGVGSSGRRQDDGERKAVPARAVAWAVSNAVSGAHGAGRIGDPSNRRCEDINGPLFVEFRSAPGPFSRPR